MQLPELAKAAANNKTVLVSLEPQPQPQVVPPGIVSVAPVPVSLSPAHPSPASGVSPWWKTRTGVGVLCVGGVVLLVLALVAVLILVLRTPHYTVPELVSAYHRGMNGKRVRVTGPVRVIEPSNRGSGMFVLLYTPGQHSEVAVFDLNRVPRTIRMDEVVTLEGDIHEMLILRPQTLRDGRRIEETADIVVLKNARLE
jgi:hypothetical protein